MFLPKAPPYDALAWAKMSFADRARLSCQAWAVQGYGSPLGAYIIYVLKIVGYIAGWIYFCSFSPGLGTWGTISWWLVPVAFQKAIVWSMLFEVLGLGCGSGPLTGRYFPPVGGFLYFLRPKTTKMPLFEGAPIIGGRTRGILEIVAYASVLVYSILCLIHPAPGFEQFLPIIISLVIAGILDKTVFLAARAEHYWVTIVVFAFAQNWIAGAMIVQLSIWLFAGFSKLNAHFPSVVCVMASNSPFTPFSWFRKAMYKNYPEDLRPSSTAVAKAYMGIVLELGTPIVLFTAIMTGSQTVLIVGLTMMVFLHTYITSNFPMGVPIEWNFLVVYSGFFLFRANPTITPFQLDSAPVAAFLFVFSFSLPLIGNIRPDWISFLLAMRYYAGNWAVSVWMFKDDSYKKLEKLTKTSGWLYDQLDMFYERKVSVGLVSKVMAFRLMHLHGKAFQKLVPKAVKNFEKYEWVEGELIAGMVVGWNFGEGHLHSEQLLRSVQAQCGFKDEELRCIFIEGQPLGKSTINYRIHDAEKGLIEDGKIEVADLKELQPWPTK
ncbi:hypothetical protein CH352_14775 [Leptospira hartskeerlii]|uniref:DUF3556 domain-containing protein n=1 Tax=Leptospira hartskeerlii TaxID=2023177 RepID=A0A2M9XCR0_9LEPT|nr:DUF3556 domain-containing protein [Leptospira hartskeerlii]PJZ25424.1 hypothetical protein CH357_10910 [Leptospira hartskeerlii]PJZ32597.1 hypothetical protein CH352_14775 [Leptospira hartskeerlii]